MNFHYAFLNTFRWRTPDCCFGGRVCQARSLLAKLIGHITLRRDRDHLVAELRGYLPGLLEIDAVWKSVVPEERHPLQSVWPVVRVRVA